jgi:hypothetical protein
LVSNIYRMTEATAANMWFAAMLADE